MKQTIFNYLIEQAKAHGLVFLMLLGAIYWLNDKVDAANEKSDVCSEKQIQYLQEDRAKMISVIENNTAVMQEMLEVLEKRK
jgi:hypothetical protein